jgi:hypothetical protein
VLALVVIDRVFTCIGGVMKLYLHASGLSRVNTVMLIGVGNSGIWVYIRCE